MGLDGRDSLTQESDGREGEQGPGYVLLIRAGGMGILHPPTMSGDKLSVNSREMAVGIEGNFSGNRGDGVVLAGLAPGSEIRVSGIDHYGKGQVVFFDSLLDEIEICAASERMDRDEQWHRWILHGVPMLLLEAGKFVNTWGTRYAPEMEDDGSALMVGQANGVGVEPLGILEGRGWFTAELIVEGCPSLPGANKEFELRVGITYGIRDISCVVGKAISFGEIRLK